MVKLVITYPHRREKGIVPTKQIIVKSTARPNRKLGFNEWIKSIHKIK